jgi:hypothetical protein
MVWKIVQREKSLWCDLLYAKYMRKNDFFSAKKEGVAKGQTFIQMEGAVDKVGSGVQTKFWLDVWLGGVPLKICYPKLYEVCRNPDDLVKDM